MAMEVHGVPGSAFGSSGAFVFSYKPLGLVQVYGLFGAGIWGLGRRCMASLAQIYGFLGAGVEKG
jgi:hypothetical protein